MPPPESIEIYWHHRAALLVMSIMLVAVVFELVRRGYLKERYALLWLATSATGLIVGIFPQVIVWFSHTFQFQFLTVILAITFLFTLGLVLAFSIVLSRLTERHRRLTQEVALLTETVKQLERNDGQ